VARVAAADAADELLTRGEDVLDRAEDLAAAADKVLSDAFDTFSSAVSGAASKALDRAAKAVQRQALERGPGAAGGGARAEGEGGSGSAAPAGASASSALALPLAAAEGAGCRLELHVFSAGELLWSSQGAGEAGAGAIPWRSVEDGSATFAIGAPLLGDLVVRCRHVRGDGGRETLFRAALHTGYISGYLLRLGKRGGAAKGVLLELVRSLAACVGAEAAARAGQAREPAAARREASAGLADRSRMPSHFTSWSSSSRLRRSGRRRCPWWRF
jgi:hypothetical protein